MRKVSFKEVEDIADADKDLPEVDTLRIFRMNAKEWPFILGGGVASLVMGASMPVYAVLFGEVLGLLSEPVTSTLNLSLPYYPNLTSAAAIYKSLKRCFLSIFLPAINIYFESICKDNRFHTSLSVAYMYLVDFSFLCVLRLIFGNCLKNFNIV